MRLPGPALGAVEIGINRYLAIDEDVLAQCARLDGRSLAIEIEDLDARLRVVFIPAGVCLLEDAEPAEVTIAGRSGALLRMARAQAGGRGELPGGVSVAGDVALLERVRSMAATIGFDIEELLAEVMPGAAAHRAAGLLRGFADWAGQAARTLGLDTAEYLREETRDLVHREDVEQWMDAVDTLRDGVDRAAGAPRRVERSRREAEA